MILITVTKGLDIKKEKDKEWKKGDGSIFSEVKKSNGTFFGK